MSTLSDVTLLMADNAPYLELAREVFTSETRRFVGNVLEGARRTRSEPWTNGRVKVELPREVSTELKISAYLRSQFALARAELRFKKGAKYVVVAEVPFGIAFDDRANTFTWQVNLEPMSKYPRLDDEVWRACQSSLVSFPEALHDNATNTVRFVSRPVSKELSAEGAYADAKAVLDFLLGLADPIAAAVGIDLISGEAETAE